MRQRLQLGLLDNGDIVVGGLEADLVLCGMRRGAMARYGVGIRNTVEREEPALENPVSARAISIVATELVVPSPKIQTLAGMTTPRQVESSTRRRGRSRTLRPRS